MPKESSPHAADHHDLIRVLGARENNLKDITLELPKRRLTVFTGVSGSGKSSLVFGTIAAESQRLINETYSAFVQGFMPSLSRPDVDGTFARLVANNAEVIQEPADQPYGVRDCAVRDPAGNTLRIQQIS